MISGTVASWWWWVELARVPSWHLFLSAVMTFFRETEGNNTLQRNCFARLHPWQCSLGPSLNPGRLCAVPRDCCSMFDAH